MARRKWLASVWPQIAGHSVASIWPQVAGHKGLATNGCKWLATNGWPQVAGRKWLATNGWPQVAGRQWLATNAWPRPQMTGHKWHLSPPFVASQLRHCSMPVWAAVALVASHLCPCASYGQPFAADHLWPAIGGQPFV